MPASDSFVLARADGGAEIPLGAALTIGSSETCDVHLDSPAVATRHVRIADGFIEALEPCAVGGVALERGARRRIETETSLHVAGIEFFIRRTLEIAAANESTIRSALDAVAQADVGWSLVVVEGPDTGLRSRLIESAIMVVGRGSTSALELTDPSVSREHVSVVRSGDVVYVRDLGSIGGTFLGGTRLQPHRRAVWPVTQMLAIGESVLACRAPTRPERLHAALARWDAAAATPVDEVALDSEDNDAPKETAETPPAPSRAGHAEPPIAELPPPGDPSKPRLHRAEWTAVAFGIAFVLGAVGVVFAIVTLIYLLFA